MRGKSPSLLSGEVEGDLAVGRYLGRDDLRRICYEVECLRCGGKTTMAYQSIKRAKESEPCQRPWCLEKKEPVERILRELRQ